MITWNLPLTDGTNLLDGIHSGLLSELRHVALSCFIDPRGYRHKYTSAFVISSTLRHLARWMVDNKYDGISQLDAHAFNEQLDDIFYHFKGAVDDGLDGLPEEVQDEELHEVVSGVIDEDIKIGVGYLWGRFKAWKLIWEQRMSLAESGITITTQPFHTKSLHRLARDLATVAVGRIPPVPDRIAIKVLNEAHAFVDEYADKLIRFSDIVGTYVINESPSKNRLTRLIKNTGIYDWLPDHSKVHPKSIGVFFYDMLGACVTILQAETAMRINEICALPGGFNSVTGLPDCVEIVTSISGTMELFYLRSALTKTRRTAAVRKWLLAARIKGSTELPAAVRAVEVLYRLFKPWRSATDKAEDNRLVVRFFEFSNYLPLSAPAVVRFKQSFMLTIKCRLFISRYVDLSDLPDSPEFIEYKQTLGTCITSHQWRKTYARFVYQVDGRLLPAIARQFKHISIAMTEGAYVGTDLKVFHEVAEHNKNKAVDLLLEYARGTRTDREGRLAKLIGKYQAELAEMVSGKSEIEALEIVSHWVTERDMKMFFHSYGGCIPVISPTEAECHKRAGTSHWANKEPNYRHRGASTCTGCFLFVAGPETIDYWSQRFVDNMTSWMEAKNSGRETQFRVHLDRANQSAKYLKTLGATIPIISDLETNNDQ